MSKLKNCRNTPSNRNPDSKFYDVIVIGGGIGGCATAVKLANTGYSVALVEKREFLMQATSKNTPGRMGLGFHYFPSSTAKMYLENTIRFMREYPNLVIGREKCGYEYLKKGRYFIVKNSLVPAKELLEYYKKLKNAYEYLVEDDPNNKIFGEPKDFYRILPVGEYAGDVKKDIVEIGIETQEQLLDYNLFVPHFTKRVYENDNISLICGAKVSKVTQGTNRNFVVDFVRDEQNFRISSHIVVNAAWENIEIINKVSGVKSLDNQTNRLKLLAEVRLPKNLQKCHSMFFCVGPHAMFSNLGNGMARITFAPVTNQEIKTDEPLSILAQRWLSDGLSLNEKQFYGSKIIEGVANYIPKMLDAELNNVFAGIVKTNGKVDLEERKSDFHERNYSGVDRKQLGWIDNACIKLTYCENNAGEVAHLVKEDMAQLLGSQKFPAHLRI